MKGVNEMEKVILVKDVNGDLHPVNIEDLPPIQTVFGMDMETIGELRNGYLRMGGVADITKESVIETFTEVLTK